MIGHHEHAIADTDAAVGVPAGHAFRARPLVMPDPPALPASSAKHSFTAVTYIRPSTTTGVTCRLPASGTVNVHRGARR